VTPVNAGMGIVKLATLCTPGLVVYMG